MTAIGSLILPGEIETNVLVNDESFAARGVEVAVPRIGWLFANESRRMVAQKGFERHDTSANDGEVGVDDTILGSAMDQIQRWMGNHAHPQGRDDGDPGLVRRGKYWVYGRDTDNAGDESAMPSS